MRSSRIALYLVVITMAAAYLLPLLVVVLNSVRSTPDIFREVVKSQLTGKPDHPAAEDVRS